MKKHAKQKLWQAITCLACAALTWTFADDLGASEFGGGRVTGPLLTMFYCGTLLFVAALVATFVYPRVAAAIALTASLFCLPLYLYFTAPGPFRWVVKGEYKVPLQASFAWNQSAIAGILALGVTVYVCLRNLSAFSSKPSQYQNGNPSLAG
jgi:hypothetical protein